MILLGPGGKQECLVAQILVVSLLSDQYLMKSNISSQGTLVNFFMAGTTYLVTVAKEGRIYSQLKGAVHHDKDATAGSA